MTANTLLATGLKMNSDMLQSTLADFSEADMLVRPVPAANHAAWQLGHLATLEVMVANVLAPQKAPKSQPGFDEKFGSKGTKNDDAASFPSKQVLLNLIAESRAAIIEYLASAPAEALDQPSPEAFRKWVPTIGQLLAALPGHANMHIGQFQVIRRAIGKPVLF